MESVPQRPGKGAAEVVLLGKPDVEPLPAGAACPRVQICVVRDGEEVLGVATPDSEGVGSCVE